MGPTSSKGLKSCLTDVEVLMNSGKRATLKPSDEFGGQRNKTLNIYAVLNRVLWDKQFDKTAVGIGCVNLKTGLVDTYDIEDFDLSKASDVSAVTYNNRVIWSRDRPLTDKEFYDNVNELVNANSKEKIKQAPPQAPKPKFFRQWSAPGAQTVDENDRKAIYGSLRSRDEISSDLRHFSEKFDAESLDKSNDSKFRKSKHLSSSYEDFMPAPKLNLSLMRQGSADQALNAGPRGKPLLRRQCSFDLAKCQTSIWGANKNKHQKKALKKSQSKGEELVFKLILGLPKTGKHLIAGKLLGSLALLPKILVETQNKFGNDSAKVQLGASSYISPEHYYVLQNQTMPLNMRPSEEDENDTNDKTTKRPSKKECDQVKAWCRGEIQKRMENRLSTVAFGDDFLDSTFLLELCKLASSKSYQVEIVLPQKGLFHIEIKNHKTRVEQVKYVALKSGISEDEIFEMVDVFDAIRGGESSIDKLIKHQIIEGEKERSFEMMVKEAKVRYGDAMKKERVKPCKDLAQNHYFKNYLTDAKSKEVRNNDKRITKEIRKMKRNLPLWWDASVFLRFDAKRKYFMRALIIGPVDTPYEGGCFAFDIYIPATYPQKPPEVKLVTTGKGYHRFSPNLYHNGKVCLSLLGTWNGPGWDPKQSDLMQVLLSIQTLIMVKKPFYMEPGLGGWGENATAPNSMTSSLKRQKDKKVTNGAVPVDKLKGSMTQFLCYGGAVPKSIGKRDRSKLGALHFKNLKKEKSVRDPKNSGYVLPEKVTKWYYEQESIKYAEDQLVGNVLYAMIDQMKTPKEGFESVIKKHFEIKGPYLLQLMNKRLVMEAKFLNELTVAVEPYKGKSCLKKLYNELRKIEGIVLGEYHDEIEEQNVKEVNKAINELKVEVDKKCVIC